MSNGRDFDSLFEVIPTSILAPEQVARWRGVRESPTYIIQKPIYLQEIYKYMQGMAIWRENGTLTYVSLYNNTHTDAPSTGQHYLTLVFCSKGHEMQIEMQIVGRTDTAVLETAAFFMGMEELAEEEPTKLMSYRVKVSATDRPIDFSAAQPQCFKRISEVQLRNLTVSAEQSVVLATRPHANSLMFSKCSFEDGGTAFIDALQNRKSSFGSLVITDAKTFNDDNLKRFFHEDMITRYCLPCLNGECAKLDFCAEVSSFHYDITSKSPLEAGSPSSHTVINRLRLNPSYSITHYHTVTFPTELMLSFWRRVADLGTFVEVKAAFDFRRALSEVPDSVVQELIRAVLANPNLEVLDLCHKNMILLYWEPHFVTIFRGVIDHKKLHTIKIPVGSTERAFGPKFSYLRQLLCQNRNITVTSGYGNVYSDESIQKLYSLNRFFRGSRNLATEPPSKRSSLVMTTLMRSASKRPQRSALLLSDHTDALCELVQFARLDDKIPDAPPSQPTFQ